MDLIIVKATHYFIEKDKYYVYQIGINEKFEEVGKFIGIWKKK